jgi:hypothetical protein
MFASPGQNRWLRSCCIRLALGGDLLMCGNVDFSDAVSISISAAIDTGRSGRWHQARVNERRNRAPT